MDIAWAIPILTALAAIAGNLIQYILKGKDQDTAIRKQTVDELQVIIKELRISNADITERLHAKTAECDKIAAELVELKLAFENCEAMLIKK